MALAEPSLPAIPAIVEKAPETAIVVLTMQNEPAFARAALRAGARGFVIKHSAGEELVQAIRTVAGGGTNINPSSAPALPPSRRRRAPRADSASARPRCSR